MRRPFRGRMSWVGLFVAGGLALGCGSDSSAESDAEATEAEKIAADAAESAGTGRSGDTRRPRLTVAQSPEERCP